MKLQGWLIYTASDADRNRDYIDWMRHEAGLRHIDLHLMYGEYFAMGVLENQLCIQYHGKLAKPPDLAIMRSIDPLFSLQMEKLGVRVFNSSRVAYVSNDKARTHQMMSGYGIPMVDTMFIKAGFFSSTSIPFAMPWVMKTAGGRGGKQVFMADSISQAEYIVSQIPADDLVVQRLAPVKGRDMRVFVVGRNIVAAILRYSERDFRANFSLGGDSRLISLSANQQILVNRIAAIIDADMVGIDFLFDVNGNLLLNEIEDVVGSRTLSIHSDINLLARFFDHVRAQMQHHREAQAHPKAE